MRPPYGLLRRIDPRPPAPRPLGPPLSALGPHRLSPGPLGPCIGPAIVPPIAPSVGLPLGASALGPPDENKLLGLTLNFHTTAWRFYTISYGFGTLSSYLVSKCVILLAYVCIILLLFFCISLLLYVCIILFAMVFASSFLHYLLTYPFAIFCYTSSYPCATFLHDPFLLHSSSTETRGTIIAVLSSRGVLELISSFVMDWLMLKSD